MPRVSYDTKADFDAAYSLSAEPNGHPGTRPGIRLGYCRAVLMPLAQQRAAKLVELFGWPTSTRILIVGAGYAWTAEVLEQTYGYTNIVTTDTSPWVQANQNLSEEADIDAAIVAVGLNPLVGEGAAKKAQLMDGLPRRRHSRDVKNESLSNNGSRNRIRGILGDIQVGITEEVITTLTDSEVTTAASWISQINAGITRIHLTTELLSGSRQDPAYNWKTLAQWKALLPSDTFVSLNTWQVL